MEGQVYKFYGGAGFTCQRDVPTAVEAALCMGWTVRKLKITELQFTD